MSFAPFKKSFSVGWNEFLPWWNEFLPQWNEFWPFWVKWFSDKTACNLEPQAFLCVLPETHFTQNGQNSFHSGQNSFHQGQNSFHPTPKTRFPRRETHFPKLKHLNFLWFVCKSDMARAKKPYKAPFIWLFSFRVTKRSEFMLKEPIKEAETHFKKTETHFKKGETHFTKCQNSFFRDFARVAATWFCTKKSLHYINKLNKQEKMHDINKKLLFATKQNIRLHRMVTGSW